MHDPLIGLASIFVLGIGAQWLAWRLRLPSILLLLLFGFAVGPFTGWLDPEKLFGEMLFPVVSISVAMILFEGGLTLSLPELREIGRPLLRLLTLGMVVTWILTTLAARLVLQLSLSTSLLLGAILVVTGPTVVGPLLRFVRPVGKVGPIAHWEGIMIDPIGAVLAVLVFQASESVAHAALGQVTLAALWGLLKTIFIGVSLAAVAAGLLLGALRKHWIADFLQVPVVLMIVVAAFVFSNHLQDESGLLTVTLMGLILANQRMVYVHHIVEFKENLRVLLISSLFILLAARLELGDFGALGWRGVIFVVLMILLVRPAAVFLATLGVGLKWQERLFLAWMAPRGIVAAAVASVFALEMLESPLMADSVEGLVPATFLVIIGTVTIYGLTALPLARRLGLSMADPQGVLMVSAHPGARAVAHALQDEGFRVLLVDSNRHHAATARMEGLPAVFGNILAEEVSEGLDLGGIGRLLAMTPNDEINSLAAGAMADLFGWSEVYQLAPQRRGGVAGETADKHYRGRTAFGSELTYHNLDERFARGATIKKTPLTEEFNYEKFRLRYGPTALPLFVINPGKKLQVCTAAEKCSPKPGQTLISLVEDEMVKGEDDGVES